MSARPFPRFDIYDEQLQRSGEAAERRALGDTGGVAMCAQIPGIYLQGFRRPAISTLVGDVLTGRWKLGTKMVTVGERIGTDHTVISRALHWGELSPGLEGFLMACPTRPDDWEKPIKSAFNARHRSAFMGVAEYLAGRMPGPLGFRPGRLWEIHAEFVFEMMENKPAWMIARANRDLRGARQIVWNVCDANDREIVPFWYTRQRRREVTRLIDRLRGDARLALRYLSLLQTRWEGIFVAAWKATEDLPWASR